jgi:hypothetical protein
MARYTRCSGNYYGKALEVYERIKSGQQANLPMTVGASYRLGQQLRPPGNQKEKDAKGLY